MTLLLHDYVYIVLSCCMGTCFSLEVRNIVLLIRKDPRAKRSLFNQEELSRRRKFEKTIKNLLYFLFGMCVVVYMFTYVPNFEIGFHQPLFILMLGTGSLYLAALVVSISCEIWQKRTAQIRSG